MNVMQNLKFTLRIVLPAMILASSLSLCNESDKPAQSKTGNCLSLQESLPIIKCSFTPNQYERILMAKLRDKTTSLKEFRDASQKIGSLLVNKVVECLPIKSINLESPLTGFLGETFASNIELVSVMRSGDALLDTFVNHFTEASISKILIQRDELTASPHFKYMKLAPTIASGNPVVITEPMIATGGTLDMVIKLLIDKGVEEKNIIIASICTAPQGLLLLNEKYPKIKIVITVMDEYLNENMYIVPGLGDFGDRYFGTN